jgi:hypothetical protein
MSVMMDLIFSSFLGGIITLITINANMVIRQTWSNYNSEVIVQQMLISTAQIIEGELRNMGCGIADSVNVITEARDTSIQFNIALRPEINTIPTTVKYYSGSINELTSSENPNDRYLYRQEGINTPQRIGLVTQFSFKYLIVNGAQMSTPITDEDSLGKIRIIEITMEVQSPFAAYLDPEKRYTSALWKQTRLASQNLSR